jgi:hypothetical protein
MGRVGESKLWGSDGVSHSQGHFRLCRTVSGAADARRYAKRLTGNELSDFSEL